jgi:hypothetical protein
MPVLRQVSEGELGTGTEEELHVETAGGVEVEVLGLPHHGYVARVTDKVQKEGAPVEVLEELAVILRLVPVTHLDAEDVPEKLVMLTDARRIHRTQQAFSFGRVIKFHPRDHYS